MKPTETKDAYISQRRREKAFENDAIIYLRLSDFRDEDDDTFAAREAELREFAADLGLNVIRVAVENDVNADGRPRGASAYKTPMKVRTTSGLVTFRTNRPVFQEVVLDLQRGKAGVLIVGDDSRISRNERDGLDLLDAAQVSKASVVAPDDEGNPRWILTRGGTNAERSSFRDRINDARKFADDIAVKVRKGRKRWAGKSYAGGPRPYGFQVAEGTTEHRRNLVIDEAEAKELRKAADDILELDLSLRAVVLDLKARGVPTVTGAQWTSATLKDVLIKPTVAGLAVKWSKPPQSKGQLPGDADLVEAPWPAIIERPAWERLRRKLTDPARRTSPGSEPRWLVTGFATCHKCGGRLKVGSSRGGRRRRYLGAECGHLARSAGSADNLDSPPAGVDDLIAQAVVRRMSQANAVTLMMPPPRKEIDPEPLYAEQRRISKNLKEMAADRALGVIDREEHIEGKRKASERMKQIEQLLADTGTEPDPLPEFRLMPAGEWADLSEDRRRALAAAEWMKMSTPRRRAVVRLLFKSITLGEARRGAGFDPDSVLYERK